MAVQLTFDSMAITNNSLGFPRNPSPRFNITREQLRNAARALNIPRGRNTSDTLNNLRKAGVNSSLVLIP
jgi:hypothetical protein